VAADSLNSVFWVNGVGPVKSTEPKTVAEIIQTVQNASAEGLAIFPFGGQTMLDLGLPLSRPAIGVDLRNLNQVIEYPARDMTITVQAGITIAKLQEILAGENQRLPIDVPLADRATLGGAIATNANGPRRYGFGTWRDYVIGISVVNDEGHEVKAGGRVVKNVAGYDMAKLYIGSLGTLGIISQVTLKLKPRPEEQALVILECPAESVKSVLDRLHASQTRPVSIELLNPAASRAINKQTPDLLPDTGQWVVVVGFEDNSQAVGWQIEQLIKERLPETSGSLYTRLSVTADPLWQALIDFPLQPDSRLSFKANMLSSATADFCLHVEQLVPGIQIQAHAGNGIVIGHFADSGTLSQVRATLERLQAAAVAGQGNVIVTRCPAEWKHDLPIWGVPRPDAWLMRTVREKLDPHQIFNPDRMG
jgi:glycolate dehydrogenase FAD-binding subunit